MSKNDFARTGKVRSNRNLEAIRRMKFKPERNYEEDLKTLFTEIKRIWSEIEKQAKSIYEKDELFFNESAFRSVQGDIHAKVLGKYLQTVLGVKPEYETKLVGRIRADIQIGKNIEIEVKSHGNFSNKDLLSRFERLTTEKADMKHLYVAFKEREDYVTNTKVLLNEFPVELFFF